MDDQNITGSKQPGAHKYSSKLIPTHKSEIHTHFMPGLLNVNELFHSDADSLTPECNVHDQMSKNQTFLQFLLNHATQQDVPYHRIPD